MVIILRNPFTLGIVPREDFCDKEKEIEDLLRYARNGDNILLFSPRQIQTDRPNHGGVAERIIVITDIVLRK
jgi:hypothetical protein